MHMRDGNGNVAREFKFRNRMGADKCSIGFHRLINRDECELWPVQSIVNLVHLVERHHEHGL